MNDTPGALSGLAASGYFRPQKLYVFAVNTAAPGFDASIVTTYLKDARVVDAWAHYIPGVFLLRSTEDAYNLGESLRTIVRGAYCLLIEAEAGNSDGWLPASAWDWINQNKAASEYATLIGSLPPPLPKK